MFSCKRSVGVACGLVLAAAAQSAEVRRIDDSAFVLEEVVVSAVRIGALPTQGILTSVDIAGGSLVQDANVESAWELFGRMPGVMLTEFNQGTTSGKLSLRGFNGEGEVNAVKLLIDGVPSNSNDGNMPYIDTVFPLDIASLEVVRGTNDPRYGVYNIGGNANINTRIGGSYQEARLGVGSWDALDAQLAAGYETGALTQNYMVAYRDSSGYRDHGDSTRHSLSARWNYSFGAGHRAGLSVREFKNKAQEAGYLTRADAAATPELSYAFSATDGGERSINQVSAHLDLALSPVLSWVNLAYRNRLDDQRFVKFSAAVSQQERDTDETHYGVRSTMTLRPDVSGWADLSLEWGVDGEWQKNISERYNTQTRQRVTQTRNQHFSFDVYGAYAQAVLQPLDWLKLVPAFRVDKLDGDFENRLSGVRAPMFDYGLVKQPKMSAVVSLGDHYSAYANWGKSYQVGVTAASYKIPPLVNELKPSINTGWELGLKFAPSTWLTGRVALWRQTATDEWRRKLNDPNGDSENVGATRRNGYDVQVSIQPAEAFQMWVAYAHQDSEILTAGATALATRGREIDHVPHHLYSGGVGYDVSPKLSLSLDFSGQSNYFLESTNATGQFGDFFKVNLGAAYRFNDLVEVEAQVKNLADRDSEYVWWDGVQSLHSPADPRAFYLATRLRF